MNPRVPVSRQRLVENINSINQQIVVTRERQAVARRIEFPAQAFPRTFKQVTVIRLHTNHPIVASQDFPANRRNPELCTLSFCAFNSLPEAPTG